MTYRDWDDAASVALLGSEEAIASKWNLDNETRINRQRGQFRRMLGTFFSNAIAGGRPRNQAVGEALSKATEQTSPLSNRWQATLPTVREEHLPDTPFVTHITARDAARYGAAAHINPRTPPARFTFAKPHMTDASGGPAKRFIWVSFQTVTAHVADDDPTRLVCELGLASYRSGDFVYRMELEIKRDGLCPPTVFDAELGPAWAPPTPGHSKPWGITRHLENGSPQRPELLAETVDHLAERPTAQLVSPPGTRVAVGTVNLNFLAGRS